MIKKTCDKCGIEINDNNPNIEIIDFKTQLPNKHLCNVCSIQLREWLKYGC